MRHRLHSFWLVLGGLILTGLVALIALPTPTRAAEELSRAQQIAEIEKQIAELQKKLTELKKAPTTPTIPDGTLPADWVKALNWRSIGPACMSGRIVALAVVEKDPTTYWVATASGGLLKTTNNGTTWEHQFDKEATVSLGDVCVSQSHPNVVWVGTGENNPRNSVSYGDGVYKSTDGGKSWQNMGLKKSFQIGKIAIHPTNPDIVYVAALGRLYGPNEERGLYKTTDGGKTWQKVLSIDDRTGVLEVHLNPADPEMLLATAWERRRDGYDSHPGNTPMEDGYDSYDPIKKWGPGSGIYRSTDGGKSWKKMTQGLPTCDLGRIGLDWSRKNPRTVFAIVDSAKIGMGTPPSQVYLGITGEDVPGDKGAKLTEITPESPAAKAGLLAGDIVTAVGDKPIHKYDDLSREIRARKVGEKLPLTLQRGKETKKIEVTLGTRPPQGGPQRGGGVYLGFRGDEDKEGLLIREVVAEGPAARAGLKDGDLVQAIDKKPVKTMRELFELLREKKVGDKVTLKVRRDKESKDLVVTLAQRPTPGASRTRPWSAWYGGQSENIQDQQGPYAHEYGGIYRSDDAGVTWKRINSLNPRPMYFSQVRVDPSDEKYLYVTGVALYRSVDGGKTFKPDGGNGVHPDQHALWIDPHDGRHMLVGTDGGFYVTYDRMDHWEHMNYQAIGQFYHVTVDNRKPYRVYGGLQDNASWAGPSQTLTGPGPINEDWIVLGGGDGFVCRVDPEDPDLVYFESQDGNMVRRHLRTGAVKSIKPQPPRGQPPYRFNWNTPFILSAHNPRIVYSGGNFVFRSLKQGEEQKVISPEITRTKWGSATALAESPRSPEVLYAGTDDGYLWVTRDGGVKWTNITDNLLSAIGGTKHYRWVSTLEASRHANGRVYVVLDGHRSDDDEPHVYVSEDYGQSWKSLRSNLPTGSTRCLREDIEKEDLLYLGTEFALWASLNRGASWTRINNNLPTVAIHEVAVHPTAGEIVVATHGRSLWVLDVTPLRGIKPSTLTAKAALYRPNTAVRWRSEPQRGSPYGSGSRHYYGQNPQRGASIFYSLGQKANKIDLKILDYSGKTMRVLNVPADPGLHRVQWDLTRFVLRNPVGAGRERGFSEPIGPGMYKLVLTVDGQEYTEGVRVEADPTGVPSTIAEDELEDEEEREMKGHRIDD